MVRAGLDARFRGHDERGHGIGLSVLAALAALAPVLAGCSPTPAYYTLAPVPGAAGGGGPRVVELRRVPEMTAALQATLARANALVSSFGASYGGRSDIHDEIQRLLVQADETLRSVRLLSDFLTRHPEALLLGRSGEASK